MQTGIETSKLLLGPAQAGGWSSIAPFIVLRRLDSLFAA